MDYFFLIGLPNKKEVIQSSKSHHQIILVAIQLSSMKNHEPMKTFILVLFMMIVGIYLHYILI
jgi:hypothetical protein